VIRRLAAPLAYATTGAVLALAGAAAIPNSASLERAPITADWQAGCTTDADCVAMDRALTKMGRTLDPAPLTDGLLPLTPEQIDVMTEGDEWNHPWETCRIDTDNVIACPDGWVGEYPEPEYVS